MKINEIIRERRIAKRFTQEQMAGYLGVTAPAVNKWEKGTSYPDITLLPALARLLDTDLNTLLSFQEDLSEKEIALFLGSLSEIAEKEGVQKTFDIAMNKIREFPSCYALILNVALFLDGLQVIHKDAVIYKDAVEKLYLRVLESPDLAIQNQAKAMLVMKYMAKEDYTRAEELLDSLPDEGAFDKKQIQINLQINLGNLEEAARKAEEKLISAANEMQTVLMSLMEIAIKEKRMEDAEYIAEVSKKGAEIFDLWEYTSYIAHFQLYLTCKNRVKLMKILLPMFRSMTRRWEINKSPLYRHIKQKETDKDFGKKMQKNLIHLLQEDEETDFLMQDPETKNLFKKMLE